MTVSDSHRKEMTDCLIAFLRENGYPDMKVAVIIGHSRNMWRRLEEAQLILPGMSYQAFHQHLLGAGLKASMEEQLDNIGDFFRGGRKTRP